METIKKLELDGYTLFNNSCEAILPTIPDESVDMILTDPPYNIGYAEWDEFNNIEEISNQFLRILKPEGSIFIFAGWSYVNQVISKFNKNFKLNDWIIYDRIKGRGGTKRLVSTREDILWYVKGEKWTFNKDKAYSTIVKKTGGLGKKNGRETRALSNVWTDISPIVPWSKERTGHPTQKPLALSDRIINVFCQEQSVILDCYMGSGTFGISSVSAGHQFIGIEKDENYFNMVVERFEKLKTNQL